MLPQMKRVSSPYKERLLKVLRESDRRIVLRDGRTDHEGKAATEQCSPQRKHEAVRKNRSTHANLTAGNSE